MAEPRHQALSPDNPWPGLDPFDEADRAYFHGRSAESGELLRLVRRELLTVLFGRSGLGKTSLLKAGLFPLLREEDCLPVYVRLDHADGAPPLREQIYGGLRTEDEANRVQASHPTEDETLWSFFHRRDAEFWSERNRPVTPVIVFDQFEEIFTLGQETEAARVRSAAFLSELSDLIENRPPDAVKQALEANPTGTRRFDFKRPTAKVVLSFREDFLAEMEELKDSMPSLMYNRYRLLAMSGAQAYEVITRAGGTLVDDDVARRILRLAWKNEPSPPIEPSELPKIEIDPALLSVVCTELNHKRQVKPSLDRITPALLEGADREILAEFYERAMVGLAPKVRAFVEDQLLTERGHRDSRVLEDAQNSITPEVLDALIGRRLLRVDERQSVRRLELTHDVLAHVVKESRDSRRAKEAETAASRVEQEKARELALLDRQRRNRRNAVLVLTGALGVLVLSAFAWRYAWLAAALLHEAESTRLTSEAERLQDTDYGASLLVNLEAIRFAQTLDAQAGLLRRFTSHPHLSAVLSGHDSQVSSVAFSPDGQRLASSSWDNKVILWDVGSQKAISVLKGHDGSVSSVAFSPDGKHLASGGSDHTVILWNVNTRKRVATLGPNKDPISSVAFSPDGKYLAFAYGETWTLWDVVDQKTIVNLKGNGDPIASIAFSPDGKLLAYGGKDHSVVLWDLKTRRETTSIRGHKDELHSIAFSPDGKYLACASGDSVILWDIDSRRTVATLVDHKNTIDSISFNPDSKLLASASGNSVTLWDVNRQERIATLDGHKDTVNSVAFSPDGKHIASAGKDQTIILWGIYDRKTTTTLEGHQAPIYRIAFSSDGKRLASASGDKTVILWDVGNRKMISTLKGHKDSVYGVAFSRDGKNLASASKDQSMILWDVDRRKPATIWDGHKETVASVAFNPDGKCLALGDWDNTVILLDVANRKTIATLHGHKAPVSNVAFSPDGKLLASASWDKTVIMWDVDSRKIIATLEGHKESVSDVAFSPDGKRLASASEDNTVMLWDVDSLKLIAILEGHKAPVSGVSFSPDGKRLASASWDKTVKLWDVENRKIIATLDGQNAPITSVAFTSDGKKLASASGDRTVVLWDLDLSSLRTEACRTANRNLTCEEWRIYIGIDQPYHKTCPELPGPEKCD